MIPNACTVTHASGPAKWISAKWETWNVFPAGNAKGPASSAPFITDGKRKGSNKHSVVCMAFV